MNAIVVNEMDEKEREERYDERQRKLRLFLYGDEKEEHTRVGKVILFLLSAICMYVVGFYAGFDLGLVSFVVQVFLAINIIWLELGIASGYRICPECGQEFKTLEAAAQHVKFAHNVDIIPFTGFYAVRSSKGNDEANESKDNKEEGEK